MLVIDNFRIQQKTRTKENGLKQNYYIVEDTDINQVIHMESDVFWNWQRRNGLRLTPRNQF